MDYNKQKKDQPLDSLKKILQIESLDFLRTVFSFFHFARQNNGYFSIDQIMVDKTFSSKFGVDQETCQLVAKKLSMDQNGLRDNWLQKEIQAKIDKKQQKYFPNPLAKTPLIHMNETDKNKVFLVPSQYYLFHAMSNYLFLTLQENDPTFKAKFGDIIENHIGNCLKHIFGNCEKIICTKNSKSSADFKVELKECILIIEVKTTIAPYDDRSIMDIRNIAKVWVDLYNTCQQLSASIKNIENSEKTIIPIALFYDTFQMEILPFRIFAEKSGIFKDLGLNLVEFFNWQKFEQLLSKTSKSKLEMKLIERQQKVGKMDIKEIHNFSLEQDTPAHSYEYLPKTIFPDKL